MLSEQKGKELFTNFLQQLYWFRTLLLLVTVLEFFWIYNKVTPTPVPAKQHMSIWH